MQGPIRAGGVEADAVECIIGPRFPRPACRMSKLLPIALAALLTSGCGLLYKQPIYQGTLIGADQVQQLQVGMDQRQVMTLLGSPAVADPFHHDRWDYTASRRVDRRGTTEVKNFVVHFQNGAVTRWEGDYFPLDDAELAKRMSRFGNLSKEQRESKRAR